MLQKQSRALGIADTTKTTGQKSSPVHSTAIVPSLTLQHEAADVPSLQKRSTQTHAAGKSAPFLIRPGLYKSLETMNLFIGVYRLPEQYHEQLTGSGSANVSVIVLTKITRIV